MSIRAFLFRKRMERHFLKDQPSSPAIKASSARSYLRTSYLLYLKPKLNAIYERLKFISHVPFPILFTFFLIFVFISFGIFAQIEYQKWVKAIQIIYPDSVMGSIDPETGRVLPSPLDSVMIPYNAKRIGHSYFEFNLMVATFLGFIWKMHNDGAPQSFRIKGHNG